jgi:hypothetical protein
MHTAGQKYKHQKDKIIQGMRLNIQGKRMKRKWPPKKKSSTYGKPSTKS